MKINFTDTLSVTFHTSNPFISNHLIQEFSLFNHDCNSITNIDISFIDSKRQFKKNHGGSFVKFKAAGRYYLLSKKNGSFYIYLSKHGTLLDFFYRLFNPYRQKRIVLSLIDFLHNVFLGILEIKLLDENATIFHSCGFINSDKLTLIASTAQSGKTTAVLHLKNRYMVVAEDYCIVKNSTYYPLTIIKQSQNYQPRSLFERINKMICKAARKQQVEYESFSSAFGSHNIDAHHIDNLLFLSRDSDSLDISEKMCCIMKNEIENYVGFKEWATIVYGKKAYEDFLSKLNIILKNVCRGNNVQLFYIPFKETLNDYLDELDMELLKGQYGKK